MNKSAVCHITDTLGTSAICEKLGVTPHSVRHARTTGIFPSGWYAPLDAMCIEIGIPCPRNAFNWKANAKKHGAGPVPIQGSDLRNVSAPSGAA